MLKNFPIFFIFCCISAQKPILSQLTAEQVKYTFDNVMSDEYIKGLAKDFASKAAEHFMTEMKSQNKGLAAKFGQSIYRSPFLDQRTFPQFQEQLEPIDNAQVQAQIQVFEKAQALALQNAQVKGQAQAPAYAPAEVQAEVQDQEQKQLQAQLQQYSENTQQLSAQKKKQNLQQVQHASLNSQEAFELLREPEPDGDHLGSQSGELSGERDKVPVIQVMKINGAYFRRLLGLI